MLFIFDMGGVVTTTFQMDSIYKKLNITKEDFFSICNLNDKNIWDKLEKGLIQISDFWHEFNMRVGKLQRTFYDGILNVGDLIKLSPESDIQDIPKVTHDLFRLYFHPQINEETVELIKALRKKNRVVCGTNTIQSHWENHMERGDYSYFDQTYASNKIEAAKPNEDFFRLILEAEGYKPQDTFFTDDKEENCEAARKIGINAIQFSTAQALSREWKKYI
ncbi:MAG: HAD family phosphatase [Treponema sp.]|nr:HAD family phosphatase [Treponema sp.]